MKIDERRRTSGGTYMGGRGKVEAYARRAWYELRCNGVLLTVADGQVWRGSEYRGELLWSDRNNRGALAWARRWMQQEAK